MGSKQKLTDPAFGRRLQRLRKRRGLSQAQLARTLGVTQAAISAYETARAWPTPPILIQLSQVVGVPIDELLGIKKTLNGRRTEPGSPKLLRQVRKVAALPIRDQRTIVTLINRLSKIEPNGRGIQSDGNRS